MKNPQTQRSTDATDFFHRTQWAVDELAQLGPDILASSAALKLVHPECDAALTAQKTSALAMQILQAFKLLEPLIEQLEGHPELKALAAAQKAVQA